MAAAHSLIHNKANQSFSLEIRAFLLPIEWKYLFVADTKEFNAFNLSVFMNFSWYLGVGNWSIEFLKLCFIINKMRC